jgi:hypothetical protein
MQVKKIPGIAVPINNFAKIEILNKLLHENMKYLYI